jgi:uncharacterized protein DUF4349
MPATDRLPTLRHRRVCALIVALGLLAIACGATGAAPNGVLSPVGGAVDEAAGPAPGNPSAEPQSGGGQAPRDDAKIVRTGTMQLQVKDVIKAVDAARTAVVDGGGYISASRQSSTEDGVVATVTYRIPVDRWEQTLNQLRGLSIKVLDEQTDAVEVTGQVVDLEARIRNLQASEHAMQGIAEQATAIKDVLAVQAELTRLRGEIEQLQAQRNDLTDRAALGTLAVTFGVEVVAVAEAAKGWDPATEVDQAAASLVNVLQAVATAGIWFGIVWLPILLFLAVLAFVGRFVLLRSGLIARRQDVATSIPPDAAAG